ncbi:Riboflavin synthase [Exophiala dermatitidis]|uniref:Riboflavin synthase n=2 Tax=Exophiala dermatitidis TaxID=5970 RepID=H6BTB4_EXODN|nr:riboflavin synthase alpha chain [Exophiala dermatitidis NIH/UT8656]EHY53510.1 riboflavin synthase alpha chain [Exophiala dermatitidis NIH/UT8656]
MPHWQLKHSTAHTVQQSYRSSSIHPEIQLTPGFAQTISLLFTMFTGLVETIGTVTSLTDLDPSVSGGNGTSLTISDCASILTDAQLGDSISVNGTCLTVTEFDSSSFKVGVAPETLRRTNLGLLQKGGRVNLERAVSASTRMGGHFVQGHVDTVATIESVTPDGNALTFRLKPRETNVLRYVVEKGYITLDGASLTITKVNDAEGWFEVMLIAYTQERVVMAAKKPGDQVNVEIDVVGKLVEKSVVGYFESTLKDGAGAPAILEKVVGRLVDEKLKTLQG